MRVVVSVPDRIHARAGRLARRLGIRRNRPYSLALQEYVARHDPDLVTEAMDRVCSGFDTTADPFVRRTARRTLEDSEW